MNAEIPRNEELTLTDLKGDLHFHLDQQGDLTQGFTGSHDSKIPGDVMVEWISKHLPGFEYIVITDHLEGFDHDPDRFKHDKYGVEHFYDDVDLFLPEIERIKALGQLHPEIKTIAGIETSIRRDSSVNASTRVMELFDLVIASDHYHDEAGDANEATQRIIAAISNPHIDIIGHPARKHSDWKDIDWEVIAQTAATYDKAIEISMAPSAIYGVPTSSTYSLEPSRDPMVLKILALTGTKVSIGSDMHKFQPLEKDTPLQFRQLYDLRALVRDLNRAGFTKDQILNTYQPEQLVTWAKGNNR